MLKRALLLCLLLTSQFVFADYPADMSQWTSTVPAYMPVDLRQRVDALRITVARTPTTTPQLLEERAPLFWDWANAYALTGRAIHPNLPQEVANIRQGTPGQRQVDSYAGSFDWFIRELAFQDAFPDAINELESGYLGPFQANGFSSLSQTYTVGDEPIVQGGGFLVATRDHRGGLSIQTENPGADNWVNVTSNNPGVVFEVTTAGLSGMFSGGGLGAQYFPRPYFRVAQGSLNPGDVVTITMGDRSQGSRGLKLPSASNSALRLRVWVSLENPDELFSLNEIPFYSKGLATRALRGFGPSIAGTNEAVLLSVRNEDQFRNRATSDFKAFEVFDGDSRIFEVTDTTRAYHEISSHRFSRSGVHYLTIRSTDGEIEGEFNPILVTDVTIDHIYWGETHGHTGFAEGSGTVDNFFQFAREDARLDFMTLSEHDMWMDDWEWEVLRKKVIEADDPGRFLTYLGYEWTRSPLLGGHHNVLFRTPESRDRVESQRAPLIPILYELLKAENKIEDVLVIPHAHNPGRWWESDHDVEHLVEIVSNHGTFEWLGRAFLQEGFHLGFVGGSDDHIGHPGIRPLNSERVGSDNFGGMAAVMARSLDSDVLFDAMRAKQTYATNGQKIILQLTANGQAMGQVLPKAEKVILSGRVIGTSAITNIDLVKNGQVIESVDYLLASVATGLLELRFDSETDPYERDVRSRGSRAWPGQLTVSGANIRRVTIPNVENVYTEFARISENDPQTVQFFMRTRGAPRSIYMQVDNVTAKASLNLTLTSGNAPESEQVALTEARGSGRLIISPQQKHRDQVRVRWINQPTEKDRQFEFSDRNAAGGDSYYVRITQTNGGMAWSSPVKMQE
ncbi:MAG: DUF3604 domain-containing protein [Verrucomicrobia bacterium]|nr:DUF3604 domain-containing protein [Verrucomicrobiota bacterium]